MKTIKRTLWLCAGMALLAAKVAEAQVSSPATEKFFVNVNFGGQLASRTLSTTVSKTVYDEPATLTSAQLIKKGALVDLGAGYRSAIYFTSPEQKQVADDTIADVNASGLWPGKVVTDVAPVGPFWEAEPEHQDYLERIPNGYTCHFVRPGWTLPVRERTS